MRNSVDWCKRKLAWFFRVVGHGFKSRFVAVVLLMFSVFSTGVVVGAASAGYVVFIALTDYGSVVASRLVDIGLRVAGYTETTQVRWSLYNGGELGLRPSSAVPLMARNAESQADPLPPSKVRAVQADIDETVDKLANSSKRKTDTRVAKR